MPSITTFWPVRLVLLAPAGGVLIASGVGLGEILVAPALRAAFGPPEVWPCVDSPGVIRYRIAETTLGTAAGALLAGAFVRWRRYDGWLLINVPSTILGYVLYAVLVRQAGGFPPFMYWGALIMLAQLILVSTLYPLLFEATAALRRARSPDAIESSP